jgi:hypothetical protein
LGILGTIPETQDDVPQHAVMYRQLEIITAETNRALQAARPEAYIVQSLGMNHDHSGLQIQNSPFGDRR